MFRCNLVRHGLTVVSLAACLTAFSTSARAAVLFSDGFESYAAGSPPGGPWTVQQTDANSVLVSKNVSPGPPAGGGSNYLSLSDVTISTNYAYVTIPNQTSGIVTVDFMANLGSALGSDLSVMLGDGLPSTFTGGTNLAAFRIEPLVGNAQMQMNAGTWVNEPLTYATGAWQQWEMTVNYNTGMASISIGGGSNIASIPFPNGPGMDDTINTVLFRSANNNGPGSPGQAYIDNVVISNNAPPVPEPASIVLLGLGGLGLVAIGRRMRNRR